MEDKKNHEKERTLFQLEKDNFQSLTETEKEGLINLYRSTISFNHKLMYVLPKEYNEAFDIFLRNYGWHIRINMSLVELIPYIKLGNDAIDKYFIKKLKRSLSQIKRNAIKRFPHREKSIQLAFKAHRRGEYELSIPAFLILSDGIFREMTKADVFSKKSSEKIQFIEKLKNNEKTTPIMAYTIEAVINGDIIGIGFSKEGYKEYPHLLNRNRIIHGADYEFGCEVNSYKAISQFEFILENVYSVLNVN